jgi:hypothetical protein
LAIGVAVRDPARFSIDATEIDRRKKWTLATQSQVPSNFIKFIELSAAVNEALTRVNSYAKFATLRRFYLSLPV